MMFAHALGGLALFAFLLRRPGLVDARLTAVIRFVCQGQIVLSFSALAAILYRRCGWRWLGGLLTLYAMSLAAECAGSGWGLIFGRYAFTPLFGAKLFHLVPLLLPISWFTLTVASLALASRLFDGRVARIACASVLMVAWDLCADPVLTQSTPAWLPRGWVWLDPGPYYGVPWSNFGGWLLVSLLLTSTLDRFAWARFKERREPTLSAHFIAQLLAPFGFALLMGLWAAPLSTSVLIGVLWTLRVRD